MKSRLLRKTLKFVRKNDTKILAGLAIIGSIITPILASKATVKAHEELKKLDEEASKKAEETGNEKEEVTIWEKTKRVAPFYFWTVVSGVGTVFCIFYGEKLHIVKLANSAMLSEFWEYRYRNIERKFAEKCGEETVKSAKKEIAKELNGCEKSFEETGEREFTVTSPSGNKSTFQRIERDEPVLVYDHICKDYNPTTLQDLSIATMRLNQEFTGRYFYDRVDWNRFRSFLGWKAHPEGKKWSWDGADDELMEMMQYNGDSWIDVYFGTDEGIDPWKDPRTGKQYKAISLWFNYPPNPIVRD